MVLMTSSFGSVPDSETASLLKTMATRPLHLLGVSTETALRGLATTVPVVADTAVAAAVE